MGPADVIFYNGTVWTGVSDVPLGTALAVNGEHIAAVGGDEVVEEFRGSDTEMVDLGGRLLTPGIIDAHTHFISGGFQLSSVDLRDADSPEEFIRRIAAFAGTVPEDSWITGGDWDHEAWGGELPRADWIDAAVPRHYVFVNRLDGHMALANTRALDLAGIGREAPDPEGGEIVREPGSGVPSGVLKDEAMGLVRRVMPDTPPEAMDRALQAAVAHALSLGVTQTHLMGSWQGLETVRRAHERGELPLRVYVAVPMGTWERMAALVEEEGRGDERLWWGGLKAFVDGSLGSTTAWFYEPYSDDPSTAGLLTTDTTELRDWIVASDAAGLHPIVHAIGDRANDWLLDVFAEARETNDPRDRRFRVEHAQHLSPEAIQRFGAEDVIPSMQPYHAIDDGRWAEKRIGPERIQTTYAFRALLDAGAPLAFGSDWTVAPLSPILGIYAAVTRRTLDGANPDGWVPAEKVTVEDALRAYTAGSAYAGFSDGWTGTLEPGKRADLAVFSGNLLEMDPVEIPGVVVDMTVVDGQIVYRRSP